jgi:hypothetical protein
MVACMKMTVFWEAPLYQLIFIGILFYDAFSVTQIIKRQMIGW